MTEADERKHCTMMSMRENSNRISTQMSLEEKLLNNRAFDRIGAPLIRSDKENRHREKKSILTTFIFGLFLKKCFRTF